MLFRDFADLSRQVSRAFYEEQLETTIEAAALLPVDDLVASQQNARADRESLVRLLRLPYDLRVAGLPGRRRAPPSAAAAAEQLAELRQVQLAGDDLLQRASAELDRFTGQLLRLGGGETLLLLDVKLAKGAFGLQDASPAGLSNRQKELERRVAQLRPRVERSLELAAERDRRGAGPAGAAGVGRAGRARRCRPRDRRP